MEKFKVDFSLYEILNKVSIYELHSFILKYIIENQFAPSLDAISSHFKASEDDIENALAILEEYHGVVLHPNSSKIWVIHPFSLYPTNFVITAGDKKWWGKYLLH